MDIPYIYSLDVPYTCPEYFPYIFLCVFLNLFRQQKTSPYRKTASISFNLQSVCLVDFISSFMIFDNDNNNF